MRRVACCLVLFLLPVLVVGAQDGVAPKAAGAEVTQDPAAAELFSDGRAAFEKEAYAEALAKFRAAFKVSPGDVGVNFYLGRAAFETGDFESAVMAFERVLMISPDLERAKLELARSYFRLGVMELARTYFQEVLDSGPPEPVRKNIEAFMQNIDKGGRQHFWSGALTLGVSWDDNTEVSPQDSQVRLPLFPNTPFDVGKPKSDSIFTLTAALNHRYKVRDSRFAWKSSMMNYDAFYQHRKHLDIQYLNVATGPSLESDKWVLDLQGVGEILEKEYDPYLQSAGAQANFVCALSRDLYLAAGLRVMEKKYSSDPKRDATTVTATIGPIYNWGDNRLTARLEFENEEASDGLAPGGVAYEEDVYSYYRYSASLQYDRRLPWGFGFYAKYRYQDADYNARDVSFDQYRHDQVHEVTGGVTKKITDSVQAEISHSYTESHSSIELYRYDRNVTSMSLTYRF